MNARWGIVVVVAVAGFASCRSTADVAGDSSASRAPAAGPSTSTAAVDDATSSAGVDASAAPASQSAPLTSTEPTPKPAASGGEVKTSDGATAASAGLDLTGGSGDSPQVDGESTTPAANAFPVHGSFATRYRGRWTSGAHDNDLYATASLQFGDPLRNPWTGYFLGEADFDFDGKNAAGGQSPFFSLQDTYDKDLVGRLYAAYVDYHDAAWFDVMRFGRQTIYTTPAVAWFDGLSVETRPVSDLALKFGAYGGVAVYAYESWNPENVAAGAYAELEPWQGASARVDYMYLADDKTLGVKTANLIGLGIGQAFGTNFRFDANGTILDGTGRDFTLKGSWSLPEDDFTMQISFYQLLETQLSLPLQIDPFFSTLLAQFPFQQVRLMASKGFGNKLGVQGGADFRTVSDEDDVGEFNRDFQHGFLTGTLSNTLPAGLALSVTADLWYSTGDDITTWGVDLARQFGQGWNASIGSYFSLFKFDLITSEEQNDVRTYYAGVRWRQSPSASWDLRYEYEDDPGFGYFQTLRVGAIWQF